MTGFLRPHIAIAEDSRGPGESHSVAPRTGENERAEKERAREAVENIRGPCRLINASLYVGTH